MPELAVLDTSVVVGWFFTDEPLRARAMEVRRHLADNPEAYVVPHLFLSEVIHVLARKSGHNSRFVSSALDLLLRLGIRTLALSEEALARAAAWACRGLTGYDATFVGLAQDLGCRWLTADDRAVALVGRRIAQPLRTWGRRAR